MAAVFTQQSDGLCEFGVIVQRTNGDMGYSAL